MSFLSEEFLDHYKTIAPPFGFNGIGELVYLRTYARQVTSINGERRLEKWWETIKRVVNGTFERLTHPGGTIIDLPFMARKMFQHMFWMRFLPGGRGLWAMGTAINDHAALNNCAFVSTLPSRTVKWSESFCFMMNSMMLGVGMGFDTLGIGYPVFQPDPANKQHVVIEDSREGWVDSLGALIDSYLIPFSRLVIFDYGKIREKGKPLQTFGGIASGPDPLRLMHNRIRNLFDNNIFTNFLLICDLANIIGAAVVAGGIRRTAMIALEHSNHEEFMDIKDYSKHPERAEWGWASNNSIVLDPYDFDNDDLLEKTAKNILINGEPGIFILKNAQNYGRFSDAKSKDKLACGTNPCGEQTLHNYEMCNLVEVFISRCSNLSEFLDVLRYALLYAKVVSTMYPENAESRSVMERNHRIGIGLTGIADFISGHFTEEDLVNWCDVGYQILKVEERVLKRTFNLPMSIRLTTIKPSGTLSLLAGVCPGIHNPIGHRVIRRICLNENDTFLVGLLKAKGFHVYEDSGRTYCQTVIEYNPKIPIKRTLQQQLHLITLMQNIWSDNQVSATMYIPEEEAQVENIVKILKELPLRVKSISMLPDKPTQKYRNMPYEAVGDDVPLISMEPITPLGRNDFLWLPNNSLPEKTDTPEVFCEKCQENFK